MRYYTAHGARIRILQRHQMKALPNILMARADPKRTIVTLQSPVMSAKSGRVFSTHSVNFLPSLPTRANEKWKQMWDSLAQNKRSTGRRKCRRQSSSNTGYSWISSTITRKSASVGRSSGGHMHASITAWSGGGTGHSTKRVMGLFA